MKVHSDIIIYLLLKLYYCATDTTTINIKTLKKGFDAVIDYLEEKTGIDSTFNFQIELSKFLDKYDEYFSSNNEEIELTEDLKYAFNAIIDAHEFLFQLDYTLQSSIYEERIYSALNLRIPLEDITDILELNRRIIALYLTLGENELLKISDPYPYNKLKTLIDELNEKMNEAPNNTLVKLKMYFSYCNNRLLDDKAKKLEPWRIILFNNSANYLSTLAYYRTQDLTTIIDEKMDDESEEVLETFYQEHNNETSEEYEVNKEKAANELDETPYFLTIFLINLNNYLKSNPNSIAKEDLLIKKYLLISLPELIHIEDHLLKYSSIDTLTLPSIPEYLDGNSFEDLKAIIIECISDLLKNNYELTKPHIYGRVITYLMFIKTFLELSINPDSIQDIIDLITNSLFYKKPNYEVITSLVDTIIFDDSPNLTR